MQIYAVTDDAPPEAQAAALALGNFDGVHCGHRAVIDAARTVGAATGVALFDPHPRRFFQPDAPPFRLQNDAQRARALAAAQVDFIAVIRFDAFLARMEDAAFARTILAEALKARTVAVGFDFRFGRGRMGDAARLRALGADLGFAVTVVDAVDEGGAAVGDKVSSSGIRRALEGGEPVSARRMLGRPFAIEGVVQRGFQRGRTLGFPTLNVGLGDYARPKLGVYATLTDLGDGRLRPGASSLGVNPTIGLLPEPLLETFLFDFDGDLYGRTVETQLLHYLRPERAFPDLPALIAQMQADCDQARALLADER